MNLSVRITVTTVSYSISIAGFAFSVNAVAKRLSGLTGAWVKELLTHATLIALGNGATKDDLILDSAVIDIALADILARATVASEPPVHADTIGTGNGFNDFGVLYSSYS